MSVPSAVNDENGLSGRAGQELMESSIKSGREETQGTVYADRNALTPKTGTKKSDLNNSRSKGILRLFKPLVVERLKHGVLCQVL